MSQKTMWEWKHALHSPPPHFLCLMATVNLGIAERGLMFRMLIENLTDYLEELEKEGKPIDLQVLFDRTIAGVYAESQLQVSIEARTLVKKLCFHR